MQLNVQGKQMDLGDAFRSYISDKVEAVNSKYFDRATDAEVTLSPEGKSAYKTQITFNVGRNIHIMGTATEHDVYVSFDQAIERVAKQLRRYKKRLRDHHERLDQSPEVEIQKARALVIANDQRDEELEVQEGDPAIVAESVKDIVTLSVSEAVMRMDLENVDYYLFKNAKTDVLNVLYRRADGNIGWVDPS